MTILFEVVTVVPLVIALFLLVRERHHFPAFRLILMGIPFIIVARCAEAFIKFRMGPFASASMSEWEAMMISDLADVVGILLLVVGFVQALRSHSSATAEIERLEELLPLCAKCKKYRTADGEWKPIEQFLTTRGGAGAVTHGYCPDCAEELLREAESYRKSR
jgi:hypothetical protein